MKDSNRFMSYVEFKECHDLKVNYLSFYGLLSALKALKTTFKDNLRDNDTIYEDPVNRLLRCKKPCKLGFSCCPYYRVFVIARCPQRKS